VRSGRAPATGSLAVVALATSVLQVVLDVGSRRVEISAVPALISTYLAVLLLVELAALTARSVLWSGGRTPPVPTWRVAIALVSSIAVVAARLAQSPAAPTVSWLVPLLFVAPTLLVLDVVARYRIGHLRGGLSPLGLAATTAGTAAIWLLLPGLGPARWSNVDVRATGIAAGAAVMTAAGLVATAAAARQRSPESVRFAVVVLAGVAVELTVDEQDLRTWPALVSAAATLAAVLVPGSAVGSLGRLTERVRALSGLGWHRLARAARSGAGRVRARIRATRERIAVATASTRRPAPELDRPDRIAAVVMATASLLSVGAGFVWAHRVGWQPTGHAATIMARSHDVGTAHHPWVGMITSLGAEGGAAHPGPLALDLLAPFVRLFGVQDGAILGAVLATLACWAVAVWSAWRAAGRAAAVGAWAMGAVVIEIAALGAVWEANTVTITMLAMFATVLASWAAASGAWRAWWWAVGLGSLCAQAYLPHALIVVGPVIWATFVVARARRSATTPEEQRSARRTWHGGWLILAVTWIQPVIDVLLNEGGNVRALAEQVTHPNPTLGPEGFPRALCWIFALPPRWRDITGSFARAGTAMDFLGGSLLPGAVVAVALGILWWRTRRSASLAERRLRTVVLLVVLGAGLNATQLPREYLRSFQLGWLVVASLCVWFAVALSLGLGVQRALQRSEQRLPALLFRRGGVLAIATATVLVAGLVLPSGIEAVKGRPFTIDAMVHPLVDQTMSALDVDGELLVLGLDTRLNQVNTDTVLSNLIVQGVDARVEPGVGNHYGRRRLSDGTWSGPMLWITNGLAPVDPHGERLAAASMPDWSHERWDALAADVAARVRSAPEVRLQPWVLPVLPRYLAGWFEEDACDVADSIRNGELPLDKLPDGMILMLYGDLAIATPDLPPDLQEEAAGLVGQAPLEVWLVETEDDGRMASDDLLRDGSLCPSTLTSSGH